MFVALVTNSATVVGGLRTRPLKISVLTPQLFVVSSPRVGVGAQMLDVFDKARDALVRALHSYLKEGIRLLLSVLVREHLL